MICLRPVFASLLACAAPALGQTRLAYVIDSETDQLYSLGNLGNATLVGSTAPLTDPAGLAWRPDTRTLWTIDLVGGEVGTLDTTTGAFTQVFTAVPATGWQGIDFDLTTRMFWLIHGDGNLYRLDPATGITTRIGATGAPLLTALETDASGTLWSIGFTNGVLYRIDKTTGAATATVTTSPVNMQGLSFGPDGRLFATNTTTDSLYLINPQTGATSLTGAHGGGVRFAKGLEITFSLASVTRSGAGCPAGRSVSFYELFPPTAFDLAQGRIQMAPSGSGYRVAAGTGAFVAPVAPLPALGDDAVSAPINLPFSFPFPGGSTSQIRICSNGFIHLSGTGISTDFSPTAAEAMNGGPRLFPLWMDLNPAAAGSGPVCYDVDASQTRVRVTWRDVPEFQGTNLNTVQAELNASGVVEFRWLAAGNVGTNHSCLVGFSPGAANRDPGNRDLTATMPFTTQSDVIPLEQDAGRPALGVSSQLTIRGIQGGSLAGIELIGGPVGGNGLDLTGAGMPGCTLYVLPVVLTLPFATSSTTASIPFTVPNDPSLIGGRMDVQAMVVRPGANAAGVVTSNVATLIFGDL
jgi:sugar lactone lactonase YvrE